MTLYVTVSVRRSIGPSVSLLVGRLVSIQFAFSAFSALCERFLHHCSCPTTSNCCCLVYGTPHCPCPPHYCLCPTSATMPVCVSGNVWVKLPVRWSVCWMVRLSFCILFAFLIFYERFCIIAPAQPHVTDAVVYTALFQTNWTWFGLSEFDFLMGHVTYYLGHRYTDTRL